MEKCYKYQCIISQGRKNICRDLFSWVKKTSLTKEVEFLKIAVFSFNIFWWKYSKISRWYVRKLFQQIVSVIVQLDPNEHDFQKQPFANVLQTRQKRIQTTSTYANTEVTFSVVKLLKNTGIPIFSTKLLSSFLLPIEKFRKS